MMAFGGGGSFVLFPPQKFSQIREGYLGIHFFVSGTVGVSSAPVSYWNVS